MSKINILKKACIIGGLSMAAFTFAACGGNGAVVGAWETESSGKTGTLIFQNDGTISVFGDLFSVLDDAKWTYKASGNDVTIVVDDSNDYMFPDTYELKGTITDNTMILSNPNGDSSSQMYLIKQ